MTCELLTDALRGQYPLEFLVEDLAVLMAYSVAEVVLGVLKEVVPGDGGEEGEVNGVLIDVLLEAYLVGPPQAVLEEEHSRP